MDVGEVASNILLRRRNIRFVDLSKTAHKLAATGIVLGNRPNERLGYLRAEQGGWKVGRDDHQRLTHAM